MNLTDLTDTQQNYLEAVFMLSENESSGIHLVDIANKLGVRPPSATEVIARLKDMGLVTQERRTKILLTKAGRKIGGQVTARHNTIRDFLTNILRVPNDVAENNACKIEHALDTITYGRLCDFLDHLDQDKIEKDNTVPLTLMNKGESGILRRVAGGTEKSRRLAAMGVRIGSEVKLLQNNHNAPVLVKAGGARVASGRSLATCLHITQE